jgi:hypothetical protein
MSSGRNQVNLDAMIVRQDFATQSSDENSFEMRETISVRDFSSEEIFGNALRKPDFQRETNHWTPDQVVSLLECYVNGDLIPSVILWKSPESIFVIDGGHRLSALRAWFEDDYGDGPVSLTFFDRNISDAQMKLGARTRKLVNEKIGSYKHLIAKAKQEGVSKDDKVRINTMIARGLRIQWVNGNAEKAEASFFKINTQGTPLDDVEELLLTTRKKPISVASRAIIRAGTGHKYWSTFTSDNLSKIELLSKKIHNQLFQPELQLPVKTLDMPLGGSKNIRTTLKTLIELVHLANRNQQGIPKQIKDQKDDIDGADTLFVLKKVGDLVSRITGNDKGSLGVHPAVYFYGPTGLHSTTMFMGFAKLIKEKLLSNDALFFKKFTDVRADLERILVANKPMIAMIIQGYISKIRVEKYSEFLNNLVKYLNENKSISEEELVKLSGLDGKIFVGRGKTLAVDFSDDVKSKTFIEKSLDSAMKCEICVGYLDPQKSISYDHDVRKQDGGKGDDKNCKLTHPYCNQSVKN